MVDPNPRLPMDDSIRYLEERRLILHPHLNSVTPSRSRPTVDGTTSTANACASPAQKPVLVNPVPEVRAELVEKADPARRPCPVLEARSSGSRTSMACARARGAVPFYATQSSLTCASSAPEEFAAQVVSSSRAWTCDATGRICKAVAARVQESARPATSRWDDALRTALPCWSARSTSVKAQETELKRAQLELRVRQYEDKIREAQFILERSREVCHHPRDLRGARRKLKPL